MVKHSVVWNSRALGVPVIIWIATAIGFAAGAASGVATGQIWIIVLGGVGAGTAILAPFLAPTAKPDEDVLIYDSDKEDPAFGTWTYYAEYGVSPQKFKNFVTGDGKKALWFRSQQGEVLGPCKSVALTSGVLECDYMITSPDSTQSTFFAVLPMQETGPTRAGLIEVGGSIQDDPVNPTSVYRERRFVPREYYNDKQWHHCRVPFNFDGVPNTFYVIFAPRINEGLRQRSTMAEVTITGVRAWRVPKSR